LTSVKEDVMASTALLVALLAAGPADLGPVPEGTLRVFFVRHAQTAASSDTLNDLGRAQSKAAGELLAHQGVALILTSPTGRSRETGEGIAAVLGGNISVRPDERLSLIELGVGADSKALTFDDRMKDWKLGRDPAPLGGESLEHAGMAVLQLISELKPDYLGKSVVLVSHSDVIPNFIGMVGEQRLDERFVTRPAVGAVGAVDAAPASIPRVLFANFAPPVAKTVPTPGPPPKP
jgi:broad specificity phosphatase PhoE